MPEIICAGTREPYVGIVNERADELFVPGSMSAMIAEGASTWRALNPGKIKPLTRKIDLSKIPTRELLALWAQTLRELHDREVVRTYNNPIGDIAEALVALHYSGKRSSSSHASWDVKTRRGDLLQVKALRRTGAKRRNLSPVRSDDYAAVIVVIFTEDLRVEQAFRVPQLVVKELFAWREHIAGRVITVTKKLLAHPKVKKIDLSDDLLDAPIKTKS